MSWREKISAIFMQGQFGECKVLYFYGKLDGSVLKEYKQRSDKCELGLKMFLYEK